MKGTVKFLNNSGHTAVEYDTDQGIVDEAEKILTDARRTCAMLFDGTSREQIKMVGGPGGGSKTTRSILEEHEEVVVVPPMAGG